MDRNPRKYLPKDFLERAQRWTDSAGVFVSAPSPYVGIALEHLMYAERHLLKMERTLATGTSEVIAENEPLLLIECSAMSIVWLLGLYEITRLLQPRKKPEWRSFSDVHRKLEILRMPLAKHEVSKVGIPHYPTSIWSPETGRVGWDVYNPDTKKTQCFFRTEIADNFLEAAASLVPKSAKP